jgi:hypothetical protein
MQKRTNLLELVTENKMFYLCWRHFDRNKKGAATAEFFLWSGKISQALRKLFA